MRTETQENLRTEFKTVEEAKKFYNVTEGAFDLPDKGRKLYDSTSDLNGLTKYINDTFIKIDDTNRLDKTISIVYVSIIKSFLTDLDKTFCMFTFCP